MVRLNVALIHYVGEWEPCSITQVLLPVFVMNCERSALQFYETMQHTVQRRRKESSTNFLWKRRNLGKIPENLSWDWDKDLKKSGIDWRDPEQKGWMHVPGIQTKSSQRRLQGLNITVMITYFHLICKGCCILMLNLFVLTIRACMCACPWLQQYFEMFFLK